MTDTVSGQLMTTAFLTTGSYELQVVALDENKKELGSARYFFYVKPPFYASVPAYLVYFLLIVAGAAVVWKLFKQHVRNQNEKVRLEQTRLQQERIERREQKITLLKNEKLEAELRHKSKELASSTMAIIRKNEMLLQLQKEVEHQKQKLGSQYPNKYADHLIRMINENISSDDDWLIFQQNFDLIHENFFRHIKSSFPEMTAHDMKLCAFIRLNLSTKEIASLLNITIRGVEAARYRLRKKFGIPADKNLTEFLIELK
jgi:DNA-binding CsgD family transcriptional regulator